MRVLGSPNEFTGVTPMHAILLIRRPRVSSSEEAIQYLRRYAQFRQTLKEDSQLEPLAHELNEGCWSCALPDSLILLSRVIHQATRHFISFQVLYFESTPKVFDSDMVTASP